MPKMKHQGSGLAVVHTIVSQAVMCLISARCMREVVRVIVRQVTDSGSQGVNSSFKVACTWGSSS